MSFRVTQQTLSRTTMAGLQDNLARLQRTQEQLSSGRRVSKPSDSPVDTVAAMQLRADKQRTEQFSRNIDDGLARLATADDALTEAVDVLGRARQLTVAGLSDTNGPSERSAMADEIDQLRAGTIALANTQYVGQPIFAGTAATAVAFDPVTGQYAGNAAAVNRSVSPEPGSGQIAVNVPGAAVFGTLLGDPAALPTTAPSGVLADLSAALRSGDRTQMQAALDALDAGTEGIRSAHSLIGARYNRLTALQEQGNAHLDAVTGGLANAESIDLPRAIMDLQLQQSAYQAALGATAKIIQPSLSDFLR